MTPAARGLAALSLACIAAALFARGLSSGTGMAIESPGSVLVLDAIGAVAAMAAFGSRFLRREPGLVAERGVLIALGAFLALVLAGTLHGATGSWRFAFSLASLAALGLAVRDVARYRDVARVLAGTVLGVVTGSAVLGAYDLFVEMPAARAEIEKNPHLYPAEMLFRVSDPKAAGPFLLPNHFGCALGMLVPLALVVAVSFFRRGDRRRGGSAAVIVLLLLLGLILARSKGAWLALGAGLVLLAGLGVSSPVLRRRLLVGGAGVLLLAVTAGGARYLFGPETFGVSMSTQVRVEYAQSALRMAREKPLTGQGLGRYPELMARYKSARAEEAKHTHMDALELLAELGVLGPVAFLALIGALGLAGVRALRTQGPPRAPPRETVFAPVPSAILGLGVGAMTLLTYGDIYTSEQWWKLFLAATVAALVVPPVARALEDPRWAHAAAAAALAGAAIFVVDGLTDFPLHVHGLVAYAFTLAFLAPALAEGPTEPEGPVRPLQVAIGVPLAALLLVGQYRVREDKSADYLRMDGRDKISGVLQAFRSGKPIRPDERPRYEEVLRRGAETHRRLIEARHLGVPDMLLLIDAEEYHGRLSRDAHRLDGTRLIIKDALAQFPNSRELWGALGRLEAEVNIFDRATEAFDEAARCYPTQPHTRLDAGVIRCVRIVRGEKDETLRPIAIRELRAALACAHACRLERVHLTEREVVTAQGLLVALGAAPRPPGAEEPEPPR